MADSRPLANVIATYVNQQLLDEIAAEYAKGRVLLVATANLDSLEPVIWNMTAIAASKDPNAIPLFRSILLASASIPGAFPPVMIDVNLDGTRYQEMHVDGGTMAQVFFYPPSIASARTSLQRKRTFYVIRNARLDAGLGECRAAHHVHRRASDRITDPDAGHRRSVPDLRDDRA